MFLFYILEWEGNFSLYCFLLKTESGEQLLLKYNSHAKRSKFLEMLKSISKVKPNFMRNTSVRWKVKNVHARKQCTLQVIYVIVKNEGECFITGSKYRETDESTRPQAECFHLFRGIWNPWWSTKPEFLTYYIEDLWIFILFFFHWIGAQDLNSSLKTLWEAIESYEAK